MSKNVLFKLYVYSIINNKESTAHKTSPRVANSHAYDVIDLLLTHSHNWHNYWSIFFKKSYACSRN